MKQIQRQNLIKCLALLGLIFISLANYLDFLHPTQHYEYSIYSSTPFLVWIFLFLSLWIGTGIILLQIFSKEADINSYWLLGLLIIIISKLSILWIPYARGYYYASLGDTLTHVGIVKNIYYYGSIYDSFYPITHILLAEIALFTGLDVEQISKLFTPILAIVFILFVYLLSKTLFTNKTQQLLCVAAICPIFSSYFYAISPNGWSILYLTLFFAVIFRNKLNYMILVMIVILLMPFFHVFTSLLLIFILGIIGTIYFVYKYNTKTNIISDVKKIVKSLNNKYSLFMIIQFLIFSMWVLSFRYLYPNIRSLFRDFFSEGSGYMDKAGEKLSKLDLDYIELISLTIKLMGDKIIFIGILALSIIIFIRQRSIKKEPIYATILIINILAIVYFIGYTINIIPGGEAIFGERILILMIVFFPINIGYILINAIGTKNSNLILLVLALIFIASLISTLNLYTSPHISKPNQQVTQNDILGMSWYFENKDLSLIGSSITINPKRLGDAIIGEHQRKMRSDIVYSPIPDHFQYNGDFDSNAQERYILITRLDKIMYTQIYLSIGRFNEEDYIKFYSDKSINRIYYNDGFEVYFADQ